MKRVLKILGVLVVILLIALIAIPYLYKDEINVFFKEEINKNVNAVVDYDAISLSLLAQFPHLQIKLKNISITGIDHFKDTQLAQVDDFALSLNAKKAFIDKEYEIKSLKVTGLDLDLIVSEDGKTNYDIVKSDPDDSAASEATPYNLKLEKYKIANANITYHDQKSGMHFSLKDLNHTGKGTLTDKGYFLQTKSEIDETLFVYGIPYINKATVKIVSDIAIENDYSKYTLENPEILINELAIDMNQAIVELKNNDDIAIDIDFQTQQNQLKNILSLVPETYLADLKDVETNGTAQLKGFVKGIQNDSQYPAYGFHLDVGNGYLKYPDLPESIQNIDLTADVSFPGGENLNKTQIDLPKIHFTIADNSVDGNLRIDNPMSDPRIKTGFRSNLDLAKLQNALKLAQVQNLTGNLDTDFNLDGRLSAIENKQYNNFKADGFINLKDFVLKSDSLPEPVNISNAEFKITPQALQVDNFDSKIGNNDFHIKGAITNYIGYALSKDEMLKANFDLYSKQLNLNDFMTEDGTEKTDSTSIGVIKIPKNWDFNFNAKIDRLLFKDMDIQDVNGNLTVKDQIATLSAMLFKTMDGEMNLKGTYNTTSEKPESDFDISMKDMSIVKAAESFSTIKAFAPILQKLDGNFFSNLVLDIELDEQMSPVLSTLKADGDFSTTNVNVEGLDILTKIVGLIKIDALKKPKIDNLKAHFTIENGTMHVKPFDFKLSDMQAKLGGSINLEKNVDFILNLDIPKDKLGANPVQLLEGVVGKLSDLGLKTDLGELINMKFRIKGNHKNPIITPYIAGYEGESTKEIIQNVVEQKVEDVKEQVSAEIQAQADKILADAQQQADLLLQQAQKKADLLVVEANGLASKLKLEAKNQGDKLISNANNPIKKIAAQTAATQLDKEADKKGLKLVEKAQQQADALMQKAKDQSDLIVQQAQEKSENLIQNSGKK